MTRSFSSLSTVPLRLLAAICIIAVPALPQVIGVYPLGMSATNSGVTPETGISYVNQFLFYSQRSGYFERVCVKQLSAGTGNPRLRKNL